MAYQLFPLEEEEEILYDLEFPLTSFTDYQPETTQSLFSSESNHMPNENYYEKLINNDLDIFTNRHESICSILQFSTYFDRSILYLALNYLDRFMSLQEFPDGYPWTPKLIADSCISLAVKLTKRDEIRLTDLQEMSSLNSSNTFGVFTFDSETIKRTELEILGLLKWRMRSITPFSFLYFFISLSNLHDQPLKEALKARASELIFKTQTEFDLLEFKPSIIAASAILIVFEEQHPSKFSTFRDEITSSIFIDSNRLVACREIMNSILIHINKSESESVSVSDSTLSLIPLVNQLDLNQDEENTTTTTTTINDSVFQASSDDSTMVEPERDDDNNN